jgi:hypothetical protein
VPGFLSPLIAAPSAALRLVRDDGTVVAERLEAAFDSATRRRGLLGRDGLDPHTAMIIAPCNSVHTFFMRFPIDVIFVTRDGRVTKVRPAMPAWRIAASFRAYATIEMPAGSAARAGVRAGTVLTIR